MAISLLHAFHSPKTDGTDVTLVKPSNWNAEHTIIMDEGILGRPPGSGPGPPVEIPVSALFATGMISMWAGTTAPAGGWFICNGQALSRTTYAALFAVIGGYYGAGDGTTTFNVPDLRGRVPAGIDPGIGRLTASTVVNPTQPGGYGGQELVQYYADVNVYGANRAYGATGGEAHSVHVWGGTGGVEGGNWYGGIVGGGDVLHSNHSHTVDIWGNTGGGHSAWVDIGLPSSGGGYTRNATNVQPLLTVNFIIKA